MTIPYTASVITLQSFSLHHFLTITSQSHLQNTSNDPGHQIKKIIQNVNQILKKQFDLDFKLFFIWHTVPWVVNFEWFVMWLWLNGRVKNRESLHVVDRGGCVEEELKCRNINCVVIFFLYQLLPLPRMYFTVKCNVEGKFSNCRNRDCVISKLRCRDRSKQQVWVVEDVLYTQNKYQSTLYVTVKDMKLPEHVSKPLYPLKNIFNPSNNSQ